MTKTKKKPLDVRYSDALDALTPAQAQIAEMAAAGRAALATARAWLSGKQKPNAVSMSLLCEHYHMSEDELFSPGHFDNAKTDENERKDN